MVLNLLLSITLLLLSIPLGFLIAWLARDELLQGRKWFQRIIALAFLAGIALGVLQEYAGTLTCAFIIVVAYISYRKSFDKKWTKKEIQ
jgi:ABC-type Fe3+ transport system permease subunit